ncbi:unnamed protein product [Arctia plantaginis]|uniref:Nitric oxide synthase n=1 Tax=Arctia plantaginis TaxID=874455 RepID=A0A8S1B1Z8_ARCPL|nr:unnamed protein product [Arctia plantaginis]
MRLCSEGSLTCSRSPIACTEKVCQSSIMNIPGRGDTPRPPEEVFKEAEIFLRQFYRSMHSENSPRHRARIAEVKRELDSTGTYNLKSNELSFGAKLAWRNAPRCIGRATWKNLTIYDCREVTTATGMFEALCTHIKFSTNKGNINSAISIFRQRTDGKHDYRIWNPQLLGYAGYRQPDGTIIGDPARVEFTEVCQKLGWKGPGTAWDLLPLVLSADGKDPEFFDLPREIVMEVKMEHPKYDWFKDLGLQWYAVPAVSNMRMDCGGLEFTATAFNGWYMSTEIACRTFCDINRFNMIEKVATEMGLDTDAKPPLWKDKALVEMNIAVVHSFLRDRVTIVDHHTASETFMSHLKTENRTRGGCPADWIWIVPPMSSSLTPVFHQEMAFYILRPSYEYQDPAWKCYIWKKTDTTRKVKRKFHFRQIARAVKFTAKLFSRALSKRVRATILYASETGKSEHYAKNLGIIFGHAFNTQVQCMSEYDFFSIEHETLLIIVASTFGNGEPPANGLDFMEHLFVMLRNEKENKEDERTDQSATSFKTPTLRALFRTNSVLAASMEYSRQTSKQSIQRQLSRISDKSSIPTSSDQISALSNVRFAVFGLGSSAYPKFCNFAVNIDNILDELGAERLLPVARGDELCGQEQAFRKWSSDIFQVSCETFCLDENDMMKDAQNAFDTISLTPETVRFGLPNRNDCEQLTLRQGLESAYRKQMLSLKVEEVKYLGKHEATKSATIFVNLKSEHSKYDPGDHIAILPCNPRNDVDVILSRITDADNYDKQVQLQVQVEKLTATGIAKSWVNHDHLPPVSVRDIFTRFVDITSPPKIPVLKYLASACTDSNEAEKIRELIADSNKYDDWSYFNHPNIADVLEQFPSCKPKGSMLAASLPPLQPRRYSISSSPLVHRDNVHLTVAVVVFRTQNGNGPLRQGVCSTYLQNLKPGDEVIGFMRRAPTFHMPESISAPIIMVGPGTGIAPFRGFWHHRRHLIQHSKQNAGPAWLYFGCKYKDMDLYKEEKEKVVEEKVIHKARLAMSREAGVEKKYVQAYLEDDAKDLCRMLTEEEGHFYVCGDIKMADDVRSKLKEIFIKHAGMTDEEVEDFLIEMVNENRYHQDIYGVTFRTAEVHSASRETAKRTRLESLR